MKEILKLIPHEYRKGCLRVALLVPVQAVLGLVGVAALLPAMMLVLEPEKLQASFLGRFSDYLNFSSGPRFALFIILAVVLLLMLKTMLSLIIVNYQSRFLMKLYRNLSSRLLTSLYSRGLLYIKNQNSARLTFNVIGVCYNFVMGYLGGIMSLIGEIVFVLFLLLALVLYSPAASLMALCAFVPVILLYFLFVRKPLRKVNAMENEARREQNKLLYEAFRGYSEVQINDAFPGIQRRFYDGLRNISEYRIRSGIIQSIPSYLLELSVVIIVAVMIMFSFRATDADNILFLGVFAVVLMKLLPAIKGIISCISALSATQYTKEVISEINKASVFNLLHEEKIEPMPFDSAIDVREVSFKFEDDTEYVFANLNFTIHKGERFGIKGRTGAGKTTLFNILLGLYPPTSGTVAVDGVALTVENVASWHKIIGYVPQDVFIADTTIAENVAMGCEVVDRDKVRSALEQASLLEFVDSLPKGIDTNIGEAGSRISGGQRQRLGIARALYKDASVLFFDEATSSLDVDTEREVNKAIEDLSDTHRELTIIIISHRASTLAFCDRIYHL